MYQTIIDIAICLLQKIETPLNFRSYVSFTGLAFYIAVRCGFDKHLCLRSCLNAHNHNICIRLPQTSTSRRCYDNHHNNRLKYMSYVSIVTGKMFHCFCFNNHSDSVTEIVRLDQCDYYNQKQNEVLFVNIENMDFLPPIVPSLLLRA